MKGHLSFKIVSLLLLFLFCFHSTAFANSSWQWLTESPKKFLPYAVILTVTIEIIALLMFGKLVKNRKIKIMVASIVIGANLTSFLLPYLYRMKELRIFASSWFGAWDMAFSKGPYYIVLMGYLVLTTPIIYLFFRKHTKDKRILLTVIILANVVTTAIVSVIERMMFYGRW